MTKYKQKLESQIEFSGQRMCEAQDAGKTREVDTWNGYRQALRLAVSLLKVSTLTDQPVVETKQCTCDHGDLRPFGECICGSDKVAPV